LRDEMGRDASARWAVAVEVVVVVVVEELELERAERAC
jgi:hypothetical protein